MKRTSDVTILGTVVYSVSISTTRFTLRSHKSLGSTQMNNQSKASKGDLPRSLEMKKNLQWLSPTRVCKKQLSEMFVTENVDDVYGYMHF